jgi:hypothetical protein
MATMSLDLWSNLQTLLHPPSLSRFASACLCPSPSLVKAAGLQLSTQCGLARISLLLAMALGASPGRCAVLLGDAFAYPDGPLVEVSAGTWLHHSGTADDAQELSGKLSLTQAKSEDVHALLLGQPYATSSTNTLYARFAFEFSSLPTGPEGAYFAHFMNGATGYRCRIFATTNGATPGYFRLGITSSSNIVTDTYPTDLALNTRYVAVTRYAITNAVSTLWVDPSAEEDPCVTAADSGSAITVVAFAFRQSLTSGNGMGSLVVDDLVVADCFEDLSYTIPPLSRPPAIRFTNVLENLVRPGDSPTNAFTELTLQPGEKATLFVSVTDPLGGEPVVSTPSDRLPSTATWTLGAPAGSETPAKFTFAPEENDAGREYEAILQASNKAGTNICTWRLYVPTVEERQIVLNEFLANPTSDATAAHFNPLRRTLPSTDPATEDEYLEFVNRSAKPADLTGWSIADAVRIRHRFPDPFTLPASSAVVVYGGLREGGQPALDASALTIPASESSAGLALNNTGTDTVTLRNARSNLVARLVYTEKMLSSAGSLTRYPDYNSPFIPQVQVSALSVSPGVHFDGNPFSEISAPIHWIKDFRISLDSERCVVLRWAADNGLSYTLWQAEALPGEFQILTDGLRPDSSIGEFTDQNTRNLQQRFYRLSTP